MDRVGGWVEGVECGGLGFDELDLLVGCVGHSVGDFERYRFEKKTMSICDTFMINPIIRTCLANPLRFLAFQVATTVYDINIMDTLFPRLKHTRPLLFFPSYT